MTARAHFGEPRLPAWRLGVAGALLAVAFLALGPRAARAHEGPPFPILMDKPAGEYVVSVWADPDIGDAQFYIILETPAGEAPRQAPHVSMWTEPTSGRLERASYEAPRRELRNQMQFEARPYFDQGDFWQVGFRLAGPDGQVHELTTEVESTPPGYGPWDLAIYLFPFVLLGGLWAVALVRRARCRLERPAAGHSRNSSAA